MKTGVFFIEHKMLRNACRTVLLPGSGVNLDKHKALKYPCDKEKINFLFVARIIKEKGIDIYLNAAKQIHKNYDNTQFHICGHCDDKKYLEILKASGEHICYHGEQKDMLPFFQMAHCIVHPSYYSEGMSNILLEAASHARPIITTDQSGCREIIKDGESGFLVPIKNGEALVKAIERFLSLTWAEKKKMGLMGRIKVEQEFDRKIVAEMYMDEVLKICKMI